MRKHFLLLFLMALLPLVGWADDPKPKVIINAAYTYKTYGDLDPQSPNFEFDASSDYKEEVRAEIKDFLVLKRVNGEENQGEDVGSYLYYIDFTDNYAQDCQYDIKILQNNSNLVIQKAPLTIRVTNYWKKYNAADPAEDKWEWTIPDVTQLKNGDKADDVTIKITRGADDSGESEKVNATLNGDVAVIDPNTDYHYPFSGIAQNYDISFETGNEFMIVPTDDISHIKVIVQNLFVDRADPLYGKSEYMYTGQALRPGRGNWSTHVIVKDNGVEVSTDDYTVLRNGYSNNTHVGAENAAIVTVRMRNSYVSYNSTNLDVEGYFTIKPAPLLIRGDEIDLQPGEAEPTPEQLASAYTCEGFVHQETEETAKNFHKPSVTKVQIPGTDSYTLKVADASADDYKISYEDGIISYGVTNLYVEADPRQQGKTYGQPDPKLEYRVIHRNGRRATAAELEAIGGAQPYFTISREKAGTEEGENVGSYRITFDGPTVLPEGIILHYRTNGTFTIGTKTVYLTGTDTSKEYGDADPTFLASVFEENEKGELVEWSDEKKTQEGVTNGAFYYVGVGRWNGNRWIHPETVGTYVGNNGVLPQLFGGSTTASGNYSVEIVAGVFEIKQAPLTLTAKDNSKAFGTVDPNPLTTVIADGLKNGETLELGTDYTIAREEGEEINVEYAITVTPKDDSAILANYKVTCVPGVFTITAEELKVVAHDQAIDYGQTINPYDVTIYKKVNNDWDPWIEFDPQDAENSANEIANYLMLEAKVTKVGANKNAYNLVPAGNTNYVVIDDEEHFTNAWLTIAPLKTIPLDKDALAAITDVDLKQVLEDHKGRTLNVTLPARGMTADNWYSWVLPFQVKQEDFFKAGVWGYGAMEVLDEDKTTDKSVSFSLRVMKPIEPNTPFIVKINNTIAAADMAKITFNVEIDPNIDYTKEAPTKGKADQVQFIGVYEETLMGEGSRWLVRYPGYEENEFWPGKGNTLKRTNAYLQFPTENAAREAKIFIEDQNGGTTEITGVKAEANSMNAEGWYNLNGVKMEGAPSQKGVYIKDGKKVVIK